MKDPLRALGVVTVAVVISAAPATSQQQGDRPSECVAPVEEVRIGALGAEPNELFGGVRDLDAWGDGSIVVADLHPQSIRRFDRSGAFVEYVGGEGRGPGEYRSILGVEALPRGEIAVWDYGNRRITVFDASSRVRDEIHLRRGFYAYSDDAFCAGEAGTFFVRTQLGRALIRAPRASAHGYLVVDRDGSVRDTVMLPREIVDGSFLAQTPGGSRRSFPTRTLAALRRDGSVVFGSNGRYAIEIRTDGASRTYVVRDDWSPVPLTPGERDEWERLRQHLRSLPRAEGIELAPIPARKPAFRRLWIDDDGRTWVQRHVVAEKRDTPTETVTRSGPSRPAITWLESAVYDLYDRNGRFLRCLDMPWRSRVFASRGRLVWGVLRGEFHEEMVVRWRVPGR